MSKTAKALEKQWWKEAVVYQIYPRSFQDSNGDGIGDLQGIISRLDHLQELGVDVIWLNPVYQSPNEDGGYDISDYYDIMSDFGTIQDFDELLQAVHQRGMKLIMDLVLNHTSVENKWFIESRSSKKNKYRDYYIWRPPTKDGKEPNNWLSYFGGSAWEKDDKTGEYYLHIYARRQPDVNWDNKGLRKEFYNMITWWMDKGIDGFRVDAINSISKKPGLPSVPENDRYNLDVIYSDGPNLHEYLQEMAHETFLKRGVMTVGETPGATPEEAIKYTAPERREFDMVFYFDILKIDFGTKGRFDPVFWSYKEFKETLSLWQKSLYGRAWHAMALGNHDFARMVSRFGNDKEYWKESAKLLATLLFTHFGTVFIYQGDEIGMTNVKFKSMSEVQDIDSVNSYSIFQKEGGSEKEFIKKVNTQARDHARTPMQWDSTKNAGFSKGAPWMMVNQNYKTLNVKASKNDPDSIYHFYKELIALRKKYSVFVYGDYQQWMEEDEQIYFYTRTYEDTQLCILLNPSDTLYEGELPKGVTHEDFSLVIGNYSEVKKGSKMTHSVILQPWEARVYAQNLKS